MCRSRVTSVAQTERAAMRITYFRMSIRSHFIIGRAYSARVLITKSDGANKLINRGNLINPLPRGGRCAGAKVMILAHATWHATLLFLFLAPPPFAFPLPRTVSLSFQPLVRRFSRQPSFISSSFHPRLSSRAQSAVTKIDFLAGTRESAGEIEYIAVSGPSFDFSLLAGALLLYRARAFSRSIPRTPSNFPGD